MKKTLSILALSASLLSAERAIGLGEAYEMALKHDEQLKSIAFESMAASERVWQATALLLPSLELSYMYNGERYDKAYEGREKYKLNESFQRYGITLRQQVFRPDLW
ncbi:MAG: TolC family protein, partial [Campylobacter sp.]|nr:TolC family protein [Campylobacter sp.]